MADANTSKPEASKEETGDQAQKAAPSTAVAKPARKGQKAKQTLESVRESKAGKTQVFNGKSVVESQ